ncbi:hypothetical protein HaLaN_29238, partial [Haematococcus lacustris]
MWHKEEFEALATELHGLTAFASLALGVINTRMIEDAKDKVNTGMPPVRKCRMLQGEAKSVVLPARLEKDLSFVLEKYMDRLKVSGYSILLHQPHLKALWSKHFMQEQAVSAGWGYAS